MSSRVASGSLGERFREAVADLVRNRFSDSEFTIAGRPVDGPALRLRPSKKRREHGVVRACVREGGKREDGRVFSTESECQQAVFESSPRALGRADIDLRVGCVRVASADNLCRGDACRPVRPKNYLFD